MENTFKIQSEKICQLQKDIIHLEKTLHHQKYLQQSNDVPSNYQPKKFLQTANTQLQEEFNRQFKRLFLNHLTTVVNDNTVTLQLKKIRLETEINEIENILINSTESQEQLLKLFQKFYQETSFLNQHYKPSPQLVHKLNLPSPSTTEGIIENPLGTNTTHVTESMSQIMPTTTNKGDKTKKTKKRKNPEKHPKGKKQPKTNTHFLGPRHNSKQRIT